MIWFIFLALVLCFNIPSNADQITINTLVDALLNGVVESLKESGDETVSIPDLDVSFKISILKGGVTGTNGVFSNLTTLQRTGDAILDLEDESASLALTLDLGIMEVIYKECRIWLGKESITNQLSVAVNSNAIGAEITLELLDDSSCQTVLNYAKFTNIGDLNVEMSGLDNIPYIASRIGNWILDSFQSEIQASIESVLEKVINEQLQNFDLCSLI